MTAVEKNSVCMSNIGIRNGETEMSSQDTSDGLETKASNFNTRNSRLTNNDNEKTRKIIVQCSNIYERKVEITMDLVDKREKEILEADYAGSNEICMTKCKSDRITNSQNKGNLSENSIKSDTHISTCFTVCEEEIPVMFNQIINFLRQKSDDPVRPHSKLNVDCISTSEERPAKRVASTSSKKNAKLSVDDLEPFGKVTAIDVRPLTSYLPQSNDLTNADYLKQMSDSPQIVNSLQIADLPQDGDLPQTGDLFRACDLPQNGDVPKTDLSQNGEESTNSELPQKSSLLKFTEKSSQNTTLKTVSTSTQTEEYKSLSITNLKSDISRSKLKPEEPSLYVANNSKCNEIDKIFDLILNLILNLEDIQVFLEGRRPDFVLKNGESICFSQRKKEKLLAYVPEQFRNGVDSEIAQNSLFLLLEWKHKLQNEATEYICYYKRINNQSTPKFVCECFEIYPKNSASKSFQSSSVKSYQEAYDADNKVQTTYTEFDKDDICAVYDKDRLTHADYGTTPSTSVGSDLEYFNSLENNRVQSNVKSFGQYPKGKASKKYPSKSKSSRNNFYEDKSSDELKTIDRSSDGLQPKHESSDELQQKVTSSNEVQLKDKLSYEVEPKNKLSNVLQPEDLLSEGMQTRNRSLNGVQTDRLPDDVQRTYRSPNGFQTKVSLSDRVPPKDTSDGVTLKDTLSDGVQPKGASSDGEQPKHASSDGVQPKHASSDRVEPTVASSSKDKSSNRLQTEDKSSNRLQTEDKSLNGLQPEDKLSKVLQPEGIFSDRVQPENILSNGELLKLIKYPIKNVQSESVGVETDEATEYISELQSYSR